MAAEDRQTEFTISFTGKGSALQSFLAGLKTDMRSTVRDMQSAADSLTLFRTAQADAKAAAAAFEATRKRLEDIRAEVERVKASGGDISKGLARGLKEAESAFKAHAKELDRSNVALESARANMRLTEVATARLANEQKKLAAEWAVQNAAATAAQQAAEKAVASSVRLAQEVRAIGLAFQANKDVLGFKSLRDVQPEIDNVKRAYQQLAASGKLSFAELGQAQNAANRRILELRREVGTLGDAFREVRGRVVAFAAATAGIVAAGAGAAKSYRDFAQQIAAVSSITNVSAEQLKTMETGVRNLARTMGVDAVTAAKALYEIIGSGVEDPVAALTTLEQATKAAVAGITDTATAARVGVAVMNALGLQAGDLGKIYDTLFKVVADGVITFTQLADNLGEVLPAARGAGIGLETIGAAFVVLTRNGVNAAESATSITRAIQNISRPAPEARKAFDALNISLGNFTDVIRQIAERKLTPEQLGALIPDIRAFRAVQILTQQYELFRDSISSAANAAGAMTAAYAKLAATPQARIDRFKSSVDDLALSFGEFVTRGTPAIEFLTDLLNSFNTLTPATKSLVFEVAAIGTALLGLGIAVKVLGGPINALVGAFAAMNAASATLAGGLTAMGAAAGLVKIAFAGFLGFKLGEQLYEQFAFVRRLGADLANLAGTLENTLGFAQARIVAFFRGGAADAERANERYQRNAEILRTMYADAVSGATEKTRAFTAEQLKNAEAFNTARTAMTSSANAAQQALSTILSALKAQLTATENALGEAQQRLSQIGEALATQGKLIKDAAQEAIADLAASTASQLEQLKATQAGEVARTLEGVEIQRRAAAQRLAILTQFEAESRKAFEAEAATRLNITVKSTGDMERLERELTQKRKALLIEQVAAWRAHVDEQLRMHVGFVEQIRVLEERRRQFNLDVETQIREIRRASLPAYQQYADKVSAIDEAISRARRELVSGDAVKAEAYARQVIGMIGGIAQEVKDGNQVVVDQSRASGIAIGKLEEVQGLVNKAIEKQGTAAKTGADATKKAYDEAIVKLRQLETELKRVSEEAGKAIVKEITLKVSGVDEELKNIQKLLDTQQLLAPLVLSTKGAIDLIENMKKDLAANGIPVNLTAKMDAINAAIQAIKDAKLELQADVTIALNRVASVRTAALELEKLRPVLTVQSNLPELLQQKEQLKQNTSSTHIQYVRKVELNATGGPVGGFARGGPVVGEPVQKFARGGYAFRRPGWKKVPGVGDDDTVPAMLKAGSFVMRKAASRALGDRFMSKLARGMVDGVQRFATGGWTQGMRGWQQGMTGWQQGMTGWQPGMRYVDGPVGPPAPSGSDFFGDVQAGTPESQRTFDASIFGEPKLPTNPRELERKVLQYAQEVMVAARQIDGSQYWGPALRAMALDQKDYEQRPTPDKLAVILRRARGVGMNLGITTGTRQGFDIDGRRFRKRIAKAPPGLGNPRLYTYDFYREGGEALARGARMLKQGTDSVRALLTPGEWVVPKPAVEAIGRRYGSGFLPALNAMRDPGRLLAGMRGAPPVQRFQTGGMVRDTRVRGFDPEQQHRAGEPPRRILEPGRPGERGDVFNLTGLDMANPESWVRRILFPLLDERDRRRGYVLQ